MRNEQDAGELAADLLKKLQEGPRASLIEELYLIQNEDFNAYAGAMRKKTRQTKPKR